MQYQMRGDIMTREEIVEILKENTVTVSFTKVDGTVRDMRCTLQEQFLPEKTSEGSGRKPNDSVVAVWDLDKESWRSFRVDSVQSIQMEI